MSKIFILYKFRVILNINKKNTLRNIIFLSFIFLNSVFAQSKLSKWDFSYQYLKEKFVESKYRLIEDGDSIKVYLKLTLEISDKNYNTVIKRDSWYFDYRITNSYDTRSSIYTNYAFAKRLFLNKNELVFSFNVPKMAVSSAYLYIVVYEDDNYTHIQDIPLQIFDKKMYATVLPMNASGNFPEFDNYLQKKDTIKILQNAKISYYKYNFQPALPPMAATNIADNEVKLVPDTIYNVVALGSIGFSKKGNYTIENSDLSKSNILVVENKYPQVSKVKELIDPVIYIATDEERKLMRGSPKPKAKLDDFWMFLGQEKEAARKMIRSYYQRVNMANSFFTVHKEGWKSDMGMIFIIFGAPNEVYKNDMKETWNYQRTDYLPALRFIFNKKINPFGDLYYELENNADYGGVWYAAVEMWRKRLLE